MAREKREVWEKRIAEWRESGLSAKAFAAEVGVKADTLQHWKYQLAAEARRSVVKDEGLKFVEVTARAEIPPQDWAGQLPFEVALASGTRVRVPMHFDSATLRRLLDVLEQK